MFPLSIFPLPGELVPLHIFEPRYKQLLQDAETKDITFGIYFNHGRNKDQMGSLVKLESIIKRYAGGESDIIVRCIDLFTMSKLYRTFKDKMYPGGDVQFMNTDIFEPISHKLLESYHTLGKPVKLELKAKTISIFDLANELNLDFDERLKFVACDNDKKESFILSRLRYQHQLQLQAEKAKDVFHLN
jgi:uncharacterized protein